MGSLLLIVVIAALCFGWVRASQRARLRWLKRLDLPGVWVWDGHDGRLILSGGLDAGGYRFADPGGSVEQGDWVLKGHELHLTPRDGAPTRLDLRLFAEGKIGLHGPGRERRVYVKARGNVIPLRRQA